MAEEKKQEKKQEKPVKEKPEKALERQKQEQKEDEYESLVRILTYDIPGQKNVYSGLTRIKGISWAISNAICITTGLPKTKKFSQLSKEELKKLEDAITHFKAPDFMKNRRSDPETGVSSHLFGTELEMKRDFDIKRMKKIKSYKGIRHSMKLPVRGQRTRSHFRTGGKAVGVMKKTEAPAPKKTNDKK